MGMNYLAHAFLSNNNEDLLIGNFIADHIRGNKFEEYSGAIVEGIRLHRRIDSFTDAHPLFKASKRFFYDGFEKYSGVLVDIYFDHLLAKNFNTYSQIPLPEFSENVYRIYLGSKSLLPSHSQRFLDYLIQNNTYVSYGRIIGIEQVLSHLSRRIGNNILLHQSVSLFYKHEKELESNFAAFFKEAVQEFL